MDTRDGDLPTRGPSREGIEIGLKLRPLVKPYTHYSVYLTQFERHYLRPTSRVSCMYIHITTDPSIRDRELSTGMEKCFQLLIVRFLCLYSLFDKVPGPFTPVLADNGVKFRTITILGAVSSCTKAP